MCALRGPGSPVDGGTCLWVDTHTDTLELAQRGLQSCVKLAPGPTFSYYNGFRTHRRFPKWHPEEQVRAALHVVADVPELAMGH
jgi:hypothetical protein